MTIGIDISSLQGPHRMRGIGYTLINFINNLPKNASEHNYVFYAYPYLDSEDDPLQLLDLGNLSYEVKYLKQRTRSRRQLPGRLNMLVSAYNNLVEMKDLYRGDSRVTDLDGVDVFLQTDPNQSLPRKRGMKNVVVIYDMIPYVLEWDYLWSYSFARTRGYSRKAALRCLVRRKLYWDKFHINTRRADKLLAISKQTKDDFHKFLSIPDQKIVVTPLGVNTPVEHTTKPSLSHYIPTSWGYSQRPLASIEEAPFILFVGGADHRRKLQDLVAAFNRLRAQGHNIKLVLAGDSMQGPGNIATEEIQYALKTSSYLDDIIFMGFIDDVSRDWLYRHALAFVFPSKYEGFGLPVLEAMSYGCPVISYDNAATREVAGNNPEYVASSAELQTAVSLLLKDKDRVKKMASRGLLQAKKYTWSNTAKTILNELIS